MVPPSAGARRCRSSRSKTPGTPGGDEPSDWILRDVSLTVEPGETIALVGPSGAGKTTIAMLVPRMYDTCEGAVRIDGHDVRDLTLDSLHAAIGLVPQDPHLFHDTIRANLPFARPDATDAEIGDALRARADQDLVASLPDGLDTVVGERGYRMSGGEKQRLAIARLLLKDPAIVILDEATSHLDSESEVAIQRAFDEALREPHRDRDRAPPVDDRRRRPHPRGRRRPHRRSAARTRAARARRAVRRAVPHAARPQRDAAATAGTAADRDPGRRLQSRPPATIPADSAMTDGNPPTSP